MWRHTFYPVDTKHMYNICIMLDVENVGSTLCSQPCVNNCKDIHMKTESHCRSKPKHRHDQSKSTCFSISTCHNDIIRSFSWGGGGVSI